MSLSPPLFPLFAIAASLLTLSGQTLVAPVVSQKVEPEYPADLKSYLVDPARVEVQLDETGKVFGLVSASSLPDNVVQALAKWRFTPGTKNGKRASFGVFVNVPIRRPMDRYLEHASRSSLEHSKFSDYARKAADLNPEKAADLEKNLTDDRESVEDRSRLMAYAGKRNDKDALEMRTRQMLWLVANQPEAPILGQSSALLAFGASQPSAEYNRVRSLWLDQVSRHPDNPLILAHATHFLRKSDPREAEKLLLPAADRVAGAAAWLGNEYAVEALGVDRVDLDHPDPAIDLGRVSDTENAARARSLLEAANDQRVLLSALTTVTSSGRTMNRLGNVTSAYAGLCQSLLTRVKAFYPETKQSCEVTAQSPEISKIAVGQTVVSANLKRKVTPVYPLDARSLHVQGTVAFAAVIAKTGAIEELELVSGPLILYGSSRTAVLQWQYSPTLLNGDPVEVSTQVDVNFALHQ